MSTLLTAAEFELARKQGHHTIALCDTVALPHAVLAIDLYEQLKDMPYGFLYESMHQKRHANRISIIGLGAIDVFRIHQYQCIHLRHNQLVRCIMTKRPLNHIENYLQTHRIHIPKNIQQIPHFYGGLVGYFGYESVCYHNKRLQKGLFLDNPIGMDDVVLWQPESILLVDNKANTISVIIYSEHTHYKQAKAQLRSLCKKIAQVRHAGVMSVATQNQSVHHTRPQAAFEAMTQRIIDYIYAGDVMQVVPAHRSTIDFSQAQAVPLYRQLARMSPSPHMFILHTDDAHIVGASPEVLVHMQGDRVIIRPLAGTRKRGATLAEDKQLEKDLLSDAKEIAEHLMLIDLVRNDLGRIAEVGSVQVTEKMIVEKYAKVMHISSTVQATKTNTSSLLDVLQTAHPAGTLSGAPKIRALEIIQELEEQKRIVYGGFIALLGFNGNVESSIAIRTAVIKDSQLHVQAGAGVVADSNPTTEWLEVCNKKSALLAAARCV